MAHEFGAVSAPGRIAQFGLICHSARPGHNAVMTRKQWWKSTGATIAATSLLAGQALAAATPDVVLGAASSPAMKYAISPAAEPLLSHAAKQALIKANIKYVFVIFQENRSYDHFFGTFPVAGGRLKQPT